MALLHGLLMGIKALLMLATVGWRVGIGVLARIAVRVVGMRVVRVWAGVRITAAGAGRGAALHSNRHTLPFEHGTRRNF